MNPLTARACSRPCRSLIRSRRTSVTSAGPINANSDPSRQVSSTRPDSIASTPADSSSPGIRGSLDHTASSDEVSTATAGPRCGFAGSQEAYDEAYDRLWRAMDWLEDRLADRRYLMGDSITEADVRLFTTLVRFDAVYHGHFKCNRNKLTEMPNLWGYARDLYQTDGFGDTIDFAQIKQHYYVVHTDLNPTGIVPQGPDPDVWLEPHDRKALA